MKSQLALVVDDERSTRELIANVLFKIGITPVLASDPIRGLQVLEDNRNINLIVTDFQMPLMSGREFIELLKADDKLSQIPIVMVSGVISLREISDLMGKGIEFFVPKPLNVKELTHYLSLIKGISRVPSMQNQSACAEN